MPVLHYRELVAWQKAMDLAVSVYRLSGAFPREEQYGLTNQVRRAAVSIPSNIAEGQGRGIGQAFTNHLRIANGSLQEVETQIILAQRLGFVESEPMNSFLSQSSEVGRLTVGLIRSLGQ